MRTKERIIALQFPAYLKQYFCNKFGPEPIELTDKTRLYVLLSKYLTIAPPDYQLPMQDDNTLHVRIHISQDNDKVQYYIKAIHMKEIKGSIYALFYGDFINYIIEKVGQKNWAIKYAIVCFCFDYNIMWGESTYTALQKTYYRYRTSQIRGEKNDEKNFVTAAAKKSTIRPLSVHYPSTNI